MPIAQADVRTKKIKTKKNSIKTIKTKNFGFIWVGKGKEFTGNRMNRRDSGEGTSKGPVKSLKELEIIYNETI